MLRPLQRSTVLVFFFFNDTATTEIYTLSLHDALPILICSAACRTAPESAAAASRSAACWSGVMCVKGRRDRKSTRLNSSHGYISYAVFCLKKKKKYVSGEMCCKGEDMDFQLTCVETAG